MNNTNFTQASQTYIMKCDKLNLTDLGVFISGIILSCGGLLALIGSQCRNSKCKKITIGKCIKLDRENISV